MNHYPYVLIVAVFFFVVAVFHFIRIVGGFPVFFGEVEIPMWASWIGAVVGLVLSYYGFKFSSVRR